VKRDIYLPSFLNYFINSEDGKKYLRSVVSQNVGQANVNGTKLKNMPVPDIPMIQQVQIVSEIERHFSVADETEKIIDRSLKQAELTRQGILKKAFEGKLVPQDSNDESADKLLERIKQTKNDIQKKLTLEN
jgi:type I restriction enzyme S subunit